MLNLSSCNKQTNHTDKTKAQNRLRNVKISKILRALSTSLGTVDLHISVPWWEMMNNQFMVGEVPRSKTSDVLNENLKTLSMIRLEKNYLFTATLHSAKGLEYPVAFICGLEDGLFPHHFSRENPKSLEEERRLCYVGIIRAMQRLHLTYAEKRRLFGRDEERCISRFIGEIPSNLLKEANRKVQVRSHSNFSFSEPVKAPVVKPSFLLDEWDQTAGEGFCLGQRVCHPKFGQGTGLITKAMGNVLVFMCILIVMAASGWLWPLQS